MIPLWVADTDFRAAPAILEALSARIAHGVFGYSTPPHELRVAIAERMQGRKSVALTWIGDGGTSTGAFHEGFNFACVQRAPLVVVVENNKYAYSTPTFLQTANPRFVDRADETAANPSTLKQTIRDCTTVTS